MYLAEINRLNEELKGRYPGEITKKGFLTKRVQLELGRRYLQGDEQAGNDLVVSHLPFVVNLAKKHFYAWRFGLTFLDLISAGEVGLVEPLERYDFRKGVKYTTFVRRPINWAILREIELAIRRVIPPEGAKLIHEVGEEGWLLENIEARKVDDLEGRELVEYLWRRTKLSPRERMIVKLRVHEEDYTLKEVAEILAKGGGGRVVTKERVRQIEFRALGKMLATYHSDEARRRRKGLARMVG